GVDDEIAVLPRHGTDGISRHASFRVSIAGQVEPVAAPPLAVPRRGQQRFDHLRVPVRIPVAAPLLPLLERGRQTGEINKRTANERVAIRFWREIQSLLSQLTPNELVD